MRTPTSSSGMRWMARSACSSSSGTCCPIPGAGARGQHIQAVDVKALLDRVLADLSPAIAESRATVTYDRLPHIPADATQLRQVFQNLIGNALKFRGSEPPRVHISSARQRNGWLFLVHDNGIGIQPEYQERIFEVFQRLHTREEYPGTGIGLAICKNVVEAHGGRIWVESEPGKGSTFYFTISATRPEPAAAEVPAATSGATVKRR